MTDAHTTPSEPLPNLLARAIGIITSPKATFEKIVKTPKVAGILALVAVVMGLAQGGFLMTTKGQDAFMAMMTSRPGMSEQALAGMEKMLPYMGYFSIAQFIVFIPIMAAIFSLIFFVVFNAIMGGTATYKQVMSVITHSMVIGTVGLLFALPITYMRGTMSTVGPANLGALLPMLDEGSFAAKFFGMIDLFTAWGIVVESIGLGVLYKRSGRTIATVLFAIYIIVVGGIAYFTSR